jgi:hypothetical protein
MPSIPATQNKKTIEIDGLGTDRACHPKRSLKDLAERLLRVTQNIQNTVTPAMLKNPQFIDADQAYAQWIEIEKMLRREGKANEIIQERALFQQQSIAKIYRKIMEDKISPYRNSSWSGNITRTLESIARECAECGNAAQRTKMIQRYFNLDASGSPTFQKQLQEYGEFVIYNDYTRITGEFLTPAQLTELSGDALVVLVASLLATMTVASNKGEASLPWYVINAPVIARFLKFGSALHGGMVLTNSALGRTDKTDVSIKAWAETLTLCAILGVSGKVSQVAFKKTLKTAFEKIAQKSLSDLQLAHITEKVLWIKSLQLTTATTVDVLAVSSYGALRSDGDVFKQIQHNLMFMAMLKLGNQALAASGSKQTILETDSVDAAKTKLIPVIQKLEAEALRSNTAQPLLAPLKKVVLDYNFDLQLFAAKESSDTIKPLPPKPYHRDTGYSQHPFTEIEYQALKSEMPPQTQKLIDKVEQYYKENSIKKIIPIVKATARKLSKIKTIKTFYGVGYPFYSWANMRKRIFNSMLNFKNETWDLQKMNLSILPDYDLMFVYQSSTEDAKSAIFDPRGVEDFKTKNEENFRVQMQKQGKYEFWLKLRQELLAEQNVEPHADWNWEYIQTYLERGSIPLDLVPIPHYFWNTMPLFCTEADYSLFFFTRDLMFTTIPLNKKSKADLVPTLFRQHVALRILNDFAKQSKNLSLNELLEEMCIQQPHAHLININQQLKADLKNRYRPEILELITKGWVTLENEKLVLSETGKKYLENVFKQRQDFLDNPSQWQQAVVPRFGE